MMQGRTDSEWMTMMLSKLKERVADITHNPLKDGDITEVIKKILDEQAIKEVKQTLSNLDLKQLHALSVYLNKKPEKKQKESARA